MHASDPASGSRDPQVGSECSLGEPEAAILRGHLTQFPRLCAAAVSALAQCPGRCSRAFKGSL